MITRIHIPPALFSVFSGVLMCIATQQYTYAGESAAEWSNYSLKGIVGSFLDKYAQAVFQIFVLVLFIAFIYNVIVFLKHSQFGKVSNIEGRAKAKIFQPILILFVILSVYTFVVLLRSFIT